MNVQLNEPGCVYNVNCTVTMATVCFLLSGQYDSFEIAQLSLYEDENLVTLALSFQFGSDVWQLKMECRLIKHMKTLNSVKIA